MHSKLLLFIFFAFTTTTLTAQQFTIPSPDKQVTLQLSIDETITWSANYSATNVIQEATINMKFTSGRSFGTNPTLVKHHIASHSSIVHPTISHKNATIEDNYTQLTLEFKGDYHLVFRVFNDGIAYQFQDNKKGEKEVLSELLQCSFPKETTTYFPKEISMYSHNERLYEHTQLSAISAGDFCSLPVLFKPNKHNVLITETALHDYPGMFISKEKDNVVTALFPHYVLAVKEAEKSPDRNQLIAEEADYIAKTEGKRTFPWRVFVITQEDKDLVNCNLTYQLATENVVENTSWIKPGKVAWDWYNANNIYGVDFKSGLNTKTYKYFIDAAAENNIEYVILDEGWTKSTTEILDFNPDMDVLELINYGKEKGVGVILWVLWKPLDSNMDEILDTYQRWGAKGIKVDFMQRNDQYMVNSYEKIASACADRELVVNYHGAFKPAGLRRTYPNVLNYEGVKGNENNKWSDIITPTHNLTLPFIRMVAGPMDFTPGSLCNVHKENFNISWERPMSMGTRAHQVAMYVIYEAPLQMICESPSRFKKEQQTLNFISSIPTTWDKTVVLEGAIGEYIAMARRKNDTWYIGAMTAETSHNIEVVCDFLSEGDYAIEIFKDGINADRFAEDYALEQLKINHKSTLKIKMVSEGGWVAIIKPLKK